MKELIEIQKELKAPKGQYNSFGKYKYRSAEDILEAVKPLLHKHGCQLTLSDEIVLIGDRYYIKATATITNGEESVTTSAYAREDLDKKGMDGSQITGTASSYARKYALNGLFLIDDTKDADTDEFAKQQKGKKTEPKEDKPKEDTEKPTTVRMASPAQINQLKAIYKERFPMYLEVNGYADENSIPMEEADKKIREVTEMIKKRGK